MNAKNILRPLRNMLLLALMFFLLCGLAYPLALTGLGQLLFPHQANGSILYHNGQAIGSALINQTFTDPRFLQSRPSAVNYNVYTEAEKADGSYGGVATGSANYASSNPALAERVEADIEAFLARNPSVQKGDIPAELLTASGSGLDPHISPEAARVQLPALAEATGLTQQRLQELVDAQTSGKALGFLGGETVNVVLVNLEIAKELGML